MTASPSAHVPRWYDAPSPEGLPRHQRGSVVHEVRLHADAAHADLLAGLEARCSMALGQALQWLKERLVAVQGDDPTGGTQRPRLLAADLILDEATAAALPPWAQTLLDQAPGPATALKDPLAVRIAWGEIHKRPDGTNEWRVQHRSPRLQLQQLFLRVLPEAIAGAPPAKLRAGLGQEVAQQLTSHLLLADSGTVRVAEFPTAESRDPVARRAAWEAALERLCRRATPLPYARARDVDPSKYRAEDPRGDRLICTDPDWRTVASTPEARRTPLLFVSGGDIRLYRRVWRPAGSDRTARATYAALPVDAGTLAALPEATRRHALWWQRPEVLQTFTPLAAGTPRLTRASRVLVLPLDYGRKHTERRFLAALTRLPIRWARVVHRTYRRGRERDKWFLQLTIGYGIPRVFPEHALGVHFGLDNVYHWALAEGRADGAVVILAEGHVAGNPILAHGLAEKDNLEWDQARGRWVGGQVYGPALEGSTHRVVDGILRLAIAHGAAGVPAGLGVESIRWVPKGQGPPAANRRFSAWNYGQLPKFLAYKGPVASVAITEIWPKKVDRQQDDAEQARILAREAVRRFRERRKRAAEADGEADGGGEE